MQGLQFSELSLRIFKSFVLLHFFPYLCTKIKKMKIKKTHPTATKLQMSLFDYSFKRIKIPNPAGGTLYFLLSDISFIGIKDKRIYVHSLHSVPVYIGTKMGDLDSIFLEPHFNNCHEAYIVNVHHVFLQPCKQTGVEKAPHIVVASKKLNEAHNS